MPGDVKGLAILTAAAALALMPQAAVAKKPLKAKDRGAKVERTAKTGASAQQRCRDERQALGAGPFAAKYGKARAKGSARAKAKAARASFGRCVSQTTKLIRAEREAAEAEEDLVGDDGLEDDEDLDAGDGDDLGDADGDDVAVDKPELPHGGKHGAHDAAGGKHADADDEDEDEDDDGGDDDDPLVVPAPDDV